MLLPTTFSCKDVFDILKQAKVLSRGGTARCGLVLSNDPLQESPAASETSSVDDNHSDELVVETETDHLQASSTFSDEEFEFEPTAESGAQPDSASQPAILIDDREETLAEALSRYSAPILSVARIYRAERSVFFCGGLDAAVVGLSKLLLDENWGNKLWILKNFVDQTIVRQFEMGDEQLFPVGSDSFLVNINLLSKTMLPLFMRITRCFAEPPQYRFEEFGTFSNLVEPELAAKISDDSIHTSIKPPRFYDRADELQFDAYLPVDVDEKHICDTNKDRLETATQFTEREQQQRWFSEELSRQRRAARYNYRLAIPQRYDGQVQLLLPLFLNNKVVLVATLQRVDTGYRAATVLTPEMAYSNARLLGRIESSWLVQSDTEP